MFGTSLIGAIAEGKGDVYKNINKQDKGRIRLAKLLFRRLYPWGRPCGA